MINPSKLFETFKNTVLTKFGPNPAKMLIYTGVLGWFLSSAAQVVAIAVNDKIPKEQKMFLIPQEIGDGAINVLSFLVVTSAIKGFASRLVSSGRLATPKIREFLTKSGVNIKTKTGWKIKDPEATINGKVVKDKFDFSKFSIEKMNNFDEIKDEYRAFKNGTDVIGMTLGSILSCNIITPVLRNKYAADRQQVQLAKMQKIQQEQMKAPRGISMDAYRNMAAMKYSSGSLKI